MTDQDKMYVLRTNGPEARHFYLTRLAENGLVAEYAPELSAAATFNPKQRQELVAKHRISYGRWILLASEKRRTALRCTAAS